jgi:hypothetical protein
MVGMAPSVAPEVASGTMSIQAGEAHWPGIQVYPATLAILRRAMHPDKVLRLINFRKFSQHSDNARSPIVLAPQGV